MINLKIDPEFQNQIPPLTDDEYKPKRPARPFIAPAQVEAAMIVKTALHNL